MLPEENKALVRRYLKEVVSDGNVDRANEFVAADLVFTSPYTLEPTRNSEDFKRMIATIHAVFLDMRLTEEATLCEGDLVASRWTVRGTHRGEFMGAPPSGKRVTITGMSMYRIADGKIAEGWVSDDTLSPGVLQQLGIIPAQAESPAEEVVRTYFRALEEHDVGKVAGLLSDDFAFVNSVEPMDRDDFLRFMQALLAGFPDYRFNHSDSRVNGNVVTVKLRMTGTHTRTLALPMPGLKPVPATGKKVVLPEQSFAYTVRNGRITTITPEPIPHAGIIGLLEQIGVKPPPLWVMKLVARASKLSKRIARGSRTTLPRAAEYKP